MLAPFWCEFIYRLNGVIVSLFVNTYRKARTFFIRLHD